MAKVTGKAVDVNLLGRVLRYTRPYKKILVGSVLLTIILAVLSPLRPMLVEYTLDSYIIQNDSIGLLNMVLLMIGLLFLQAMFGYFHTYFSNVLGQSVIRDLRTDTFNHICSLRLSYFDRTPIGQLITRTVSDLETISAIFSEGLIVLIGDLLQVFVIIGVMFYTDWKLSLVVLIPMPLLVIASIVFQEAIKLAFQQVRTQVAHLNTFLQEHITGISLIQYFAREKQELHKFKQINALHRDAHIRSNWYYSIFFPVVEIISAISMGLLVWFGSKQILGDELSPGVIVAFLMYINMLFRPIRELADKFNTLQMGMVGAERIFQVLDTNERNENKGVLRPKSLRNELVFDRVWFAYHDQDWVLKDISFRIKPGQTLALVGATGAGKSSIINILNRFYEIGKGSISIDGQDIRQYDLDYLRSKITTVLQDTFLFSDSIAGNITLNNQQISREQLIATAKEVGAHDFIEHLPGGYDYQVMERGATLSVGQAQLISFIRALVYDPEILVLDEATSSIDTETEELIQKVLYKLMQGRTSIIIAHRLSTIQHADKIIVLDHGEIKEMGSHQELLKLDGYYKRLYDLQFHSEGLDRST
ncbi:MAG: ABC transporter ATP-binding protein [Sphingobacteriaceae bacterium]|nr:MAG: ABC transporter ATP-binding protein [Pedobacter sp.]